jgi:predicted lipoprotein with Yx(FWY)xxD motif
MATTLPSGSESDEGGTVGLIDARTRWLGVAAVVGLVLAACAKSGSGSAGSGSGGSNGAGATVNATTVSGLGRVVDTADGFTLYHLTGETGGKILCTASCQGLWPPLLAPSGGSAVAGSGVSGSLGTVKRPDGSMQVTLNGMPLYRYSGDTGAGQANGEGIDEGANGRWFAVTPTGGLAKGSAGSSGGYGNRGGSSTPSSGGGYGGY